MDQALNVTPDMFVKLRHESAAKTQDLDTSQPMKVAKPSLKLCLESVNPVLMSMGMRIEREDIKANRIPSRIWLPLIAALKCGNRHLKVTEVKVCRRVPL